MLFTGICTTRFISLMIALCFPKVRTQLNNVSNDTHDQETNTDSLRDLDELALIR